MATLSLKSADPDLPASLVFRQENTAVKRLLKSKHETLGVTAANSPVLQEHQVASRWPRTGTTWPALLMTALQHARQPQWASINWKPEK